MNSNSSERPARWGIMGTGNIAKKAMVPAIRESNLSELYAIASRNIDRARAFGQEYEVPRAYGSYRDLLKDPDVEFVYLPLPNHIHHKWVVESAKKGKNVLCEKPIAVNPGQVEDIIEVAEDCGVTVMEGFMYRFHPQTLRVKELLDDGEIGSPTLFRGSFTFPLLYQDREDDIRWKEEMGGGSLFDLGTYLVNAARYTLDDEPVEIWGEQYFHPDHSAEAETQAILKFPGDVVAIIDSSFRLGHQASYELVSGEGRIRAENAYNPGKGSEGTIEVTANGGTWLEPFSWIDEYRLEVDHFVERARSGTSPAISLEDSLNNTRALKAIKLSARHRKWISV